MTFGFGQLFSIVDGIPSPWNTVLKILLVIGGIIGLLVSTVRFVPEGYVGMRTRFGKVLISKKTGKPIVIIPGPRWIIPKFYALMLVSSRDRTFRCGPTQIQYSRYSVANVTAVVTFMLFYAYDLQYRVDDLNERATAACTGVLREVLSTVPNGDINSHRQQIHEMFGYRIDWLKRELGLEFKALDIVDVEYNPFFTIAESLQSFSPNGRALLDTLGLAPQSNTP